MVIFSEISAKPNSREYVKTDFDGGSADRKNLESEGTFKKVIVKKVKKDDEENKKKHIHFWHCKELGLPPEEKRGQAKKIMLGKEEISVAAIGAHMQIMADVQRYLSGDVVNKRLISAFPKMHLLKDDSGKHYIASKNLEGAVNLFGVEYDKKSKKYKYAREEDRFNLQRSKRISGLVEAQILNKFICEADNNPENFMVMPQDCGDKVVIIDKAPMLASQSQKDLECDLRLLYKRFAQKKLSLFDKFKMFFRVQVNGIRSCEALVIRLKGAIGSHMLSDGYFYNQQYYCEFSAESAELEFTKTIINIQENGLKALEYAVAKTSTESLAQMHDALLVIHDYYVNHRFLQAGVKDQLVYRFLSKELNANGGILLAKIKELQKECLSDEKATKIKEIYRAIFKARIELFAQARKRCCEEGLNESRKTQMFFGFVAVCASFTLIVGILKKLEILKMPQFKKLWENIALSISVAALAISIIALIFTINVAQDVIPENRLTDTTAESKLSAKTQM